MPSDFEQFQAALQGLNTQPEAVVTPETKQGVEEEAGPMTPGSLYKTYIGGPAHDFVDIYLQRAGAPQWARDMIAGVVAPETLTQAGIAAGTMLVPGAAEARGLAGTAMRGAGIVGPALKRILGPTLGGIVGGLGEQGDPADALFGGAQGAAIGTAGEVLSGASKLMAKSRLGKMFAKRDPKMLGKAINDAVAEFPNLQTAEALNSVAWGNVAKERMSEMYTKGMAPISAAIAKSPQAYKWQGAADAVYGQKPRIGYGGTVKSPLISQLQKDGTIVGEKPENILDAIRELRLGGRMPSGEAKQTVAGRDSWLTAEQLSNDFADAIATVSPKLAQRYQETDLAYARGSQIIRLLKKPGLLDKDGRLNTPLLQEAFKEKQASGFERLFTPAEIDKFREALFRGADTSAMDIIRKPESGVYAHAGGHGVRFFGNLFSILKQDKYAGKYALPAPYVSPKKISLGLEGSINAATYTNPNTLKSDEE